VEKDGMFNASFNTTGWLPGAYTVTARYGTKSVEGTTELLLSPTITTAFAKAIFDEINKVRVENGISVLSWNEEVSMVAWNHCFDMAMRGYFAHTNPEGEDLYDRLIKAGVFSITSAETLSSLPLAEEINVENMSKEVVEGLLRSPGHRSIILDLDDLYSEAGVGVSYRRGVFYITADFICNKKETSVSLDYQYTIFSYIYDPGWDTDFPDNVVARIGIKAAQPIDVYGVRSREEYERFLKGQSFDYAYYYPRCRYLNETQKVAKGFGIILSNEYHTTPVDVSLNVYYPSHYIPILVRIS